MGVPPQLLFYFGGYFEWGYLACRSTSTLKLLLYILRSTIITVNYQSFYSFLNLYVGQEGSPPSRALWRRVKMQFVSIFDEKATTVCQKKSSRDTWYSNALSAWLISTFISFIDSFWAAFLYHLPLCLAHPVSIKGKHEWHTALNARKQSEGTDSDISCNKLHYTMYRLVEIMFRGPLQLQAGTTIR